MWQTCSVYIFVAERHPDVAGQLQQQQNVLLFAKNIKLTLQLSECLSATNICEQNTYPTCDCLFMPRNSHSDKVLYGQSLNLVKS